MEKEKKRIRLLIDLPVEDVHKCITGNVYTVTRIVMAPNGKSSGDETGRSRRHRVKKVSFIAASGETVYATPDEFAWVVE